MRHPLGKSEDQKRACRERGTEIRGKGQRQAGATAGSSLYFLLSVMGSQWRILSWGVIIVSKDGSDCSLKQTAGASIEADRQVRRQCGDPVRDVRGLDEVGAEMRG